MVNLTYLTAPIGRPSKVQVPSFSSCIPCRFTPRNSDKALDLEKASMEMCASMRFIVILRSPSYRLNYMRLTINNRVMPFYSANRGSPLRRRVKPHERTIFLIWLSVVPVPQSADSRRQYNSDTIDEFCFPALRHVSYLPFRGRCAARHSVSSRHLRSFYGRSADIGQTTIPSVRR